MAEATPAPTADDKALYETLKNELKKALPKKRLADKQLAQIEVQIYNLEAAYLAETAAHSGGNIIQGFENYLKAQTSTRRRTEVNDQDRWFSKSSLTYQKSLELMGEGDDSTTTNDEYNKQTAGVTTVVVPPATRNQEMTMAQQKRLRDKEYQRKKRASVSLRSTGDSDEEIVSAASSSTRRPTKRARLADDD